MLENKFTFQESHRFEPEEAWGDASSSRLVHSFRECKEEIILFSQTPLLNIPELLSPTDFNQIHNPNSISVSSKNFQSTQGRVIEVITKKLEKVDKRPRNFRNGSRMYYLFHFLPKTI